MTASCAHRLFHAALPADWAAAQVAGRYEMSTRGRSLADEGFIHASYENQVEATANRFYGDLDELVLLELDRDALAAEVIDESPTGDPADEHFPHIYGPVPIAAVVDALPWRREPDEPWRLRDRVLKRHPSARRPPVGRPALGRASGTLQHSDEKSGESRLT